MRQKSTAEDGGAQQDKVNRCKATQSGNQTAPARCRYKLPYDSCRQCQHRCPQVPAGKGPGIKVMDFSLNSSVAVRKKLQQVAKDNNIPYQLEIFTGIGTDAGELQTSHGGVPTGSISIPSRNAHTALEVIDLEDMKNSYRLMKEFILSMKDKNEFAFVR